MEHDATGNVDAMIEKLSMKFGDRVRKISMDDYLDEQNSDVWANESAMLTQLSYGVVAMSFIVLLMFASGLKAQYGRYSENSSGIMIPGKVAWILQELPCVIIPLWNIAHALEGQFITWPSWIFMTMFIGHYVHRSFIFPFRLKGSKATRFIIFLLSFAYCSLNGYMQSRWVTHAHLYFDDEMMQPNFIAGCLLFVIGMAINIQSDLILIKLRKPREKTCKIPRGGLFEFVSGANYLGEIMEWAGFALASWSLPALSFLIITLCNLAPRALSHHQWYKSHFKHYPTNRRAIIPFIL